MEAITHYSRRGRPRKNVLPDWHRWVIRGTVQIMDAVVVAEARRKAKFILATNVSASQRSAEDLITLYKGQTGAERGFAFVKDPLFLASSVFVKKVERVMATGFIMVVCLLVYRLAEYRIRQRLVQTGEAIPDQRTQLTQKPTMRWLFQYFEGVSIVLLETGQPYVGELVGLTATHLQILRFLGPIYEHLYQGQWEIGN